MYILHSIHSIFQQFASARFGNVPVCHVSCAALAGPAMALLPSGDSMMTFLEIPSDKEPGGTQYSNFILA